ncbi:penicillin-binding transpeptidase domain-containing protein [Oscillospiraceae bacterium PP1C4]
MKATSRTIRLLILAAAFIFVMLLYSLRLMNFQVVHGDEYEKMLEAGWTTTQTIKAARGEILDRNGRPLAVNTIGRDVVIDQAFLAPGSTNAIILKLMAIMEAADEEWIDNLPITDTAPFAFKEGYEDKVASLKKTLGLGQYATVDDVMYHLKNEFKLEGMNDTDLRKVAGVRYEMKQRNFSMATPYTFASGIKIETVPKIKERSFELSGVNVVESTIRQYVSGDIAPHIVGQIGPIYAEEWGKLDQKLYSMDGVIGKEGAELAFESYLKGKDGTRRVLLNSQNDVIDVVNEKEPVPGNTVVLTIDSQLQKVAQDALASKIEAMQKDLVNYPPGKGHEADAGAVAVIDVKTGEPLALATYPSYNLSTFQKDYSQLATSKPERLLNRAVNGGYTPGSIFKPAIALAGLNEGVVSPTDHVYCGGVYTFFSGYQPRCLDVHQDINVVNALRYSCNIFFYDVGRRLGIEKIDEYTSKLGMGLPTGIEIPEYVGRVSSKELKAKLHQGEDAKWQPADTVQTAIGQLDTRLSPLQLANYAATLATNGKRMKVSILKSVKSYTFDETVYEHKPEVAETIDADMAFNTVREGMVAASRIGTARGTFGEGLYEMKVASKTGTPETAESPNSTFIAYAPADDPEIAVCVVIEKGWHGYTGAPVAREIFDAYFFSNNGKNAGATKYGELLS